MAADTPYIRFGDQKGDWFELEDHKQLVKDMITAKNFVLIYKDHDIHIIDKQSILMLSKEDKVGLTKTLMKYYGKAEMMAVHIQP